LALSSMNWLLALTVFALVCVPFGLNISILSRGVNGITIPGYGCTGSTNETYNVPLSRSCLIISDVITIAVTLWYTIRGRGSYLRSVPSFKSSLTNTLLLNGALRAIVALNVVHLVLTLLSISVSAVDPTSGVAATPRLVLISFRPSLTAILICRLLIALQAANKELLSHDTNGALGDADSHHGPTSSLRFASRVVGSLGQSLGATGRSDADVDRELETFEPREGDDIG
ncbi:hypothetical protein OH77DRAFT_1411382, partial [Trametes cingulata]